MSYKSDIAMLTSLGVPENWTLNEGCTRVKPYETGPGCDSHEVNHSIDRNNTKYGPRWMGWADE
jgi:hypothetical protein